MIPRLTFTLAVSHLASAGPWTLPHGTWVLDLATDFQSARREWLADGGHRRFPLRGQFAATALTLGARYGARDNLELSLRATGKEIAYTADSVILGEESKNPREDILNVSKATRGLSDVFLGVVYRLAGGRMPVAAELLLKLPTGYRQPEGLAGDLTPDQVPTNKEDLLRMATGKRKGDVTLGDGQVDLAALFQIGTVVPRMLTFVRLDAGINFRFNGPGHQAAGSLKLGQSIGSRVVFVVAGTTAWTLNDGDPIGTTILAIDPSLPASEYRGLNNIRVAVLTRDRSFVNVDGGVIVRLIRQVEIRATYGHTVLARNFPEVRNVHIGVAFEME